MAQGTTADAARSPDTEIPALTAGAAAGRLGVAVETLRSWDQRYGLGPAQHKPGAHRRYTPGDLARLEAFCRLIGQGVPAAEAARVVLAAAEPLAPNVNENEDASRRHARRTGGGGTLPIGRAGAPAARGLARCAIRLDAPAVLDLLDAAIARDGVVATWQGLIEPALRAVGRKWTETSGRYVEVEHLLSWCVAVALHRVRPRPAAGPARPPSLAPAAQPLPTRCVLLACAPEEWHSLPMEALAAALAECAVPARMLGSAVPEAAIVQAAGRIGPAVVVLWSQTARTGSAALLTRLTEACPCPVLAAGPGWTRHTAGNVRVLLDLQDAVHACLQ